MSGEGGEGRKGAEAQSQEAAGAPESLSQTPAYEFMSRF